MQQKREQVPLIFFGTILRLFQCKENILLMSNILLNLKYGRNEKPLTISNNIKLLAELFLFSALSFWLVVWWHEMKWIWHITSTYIITGTN